VGFAKITIAEAGGHPMRQLREALGVTAFGVNALVLPPGTEWFHHYHDQQDELYFVHRGQAAFHVGDETFELGPGGLVHVDAATPRQVWNAGEEDLELLMVGGKGGYVGRDGQLVNPDDLDRRTRARDGDLDAIRRRT
jgi:mannose-6-phosphate isomerase-like protein (cupin superfamily)